MKAFHISIKAVRDSKDLKLKVDNFLTQETRQVKESEDQIKYLPLGAWAKKGYNKKLIKAQCEDFQQHSLLGKLYGIKLSLLRDIDSEVQIRGKKTNVGDGLEPPLQLKRCGAKLTAQERMAEKERVKAAKEADRAENARLLQAARKLMDSKKKAARLLGNAVKIQTAMKTIMTKKMLDKLPPAAAAKASSAKQNVDDTVKLCKKVMEAAKNGDDIESEAIDRWSALCKDAESLHGKMLQYTSGFVKSVKW